jgi:hypothetical protein
MDFEKQLRNILAPQDPGPRFTSRMLHLLARAQARRRSRRIVLTGALLALAAAAVMLALDLSRPSKMAMNIPAVPTGEMPVAATPGSQPFPNASSQLERTSTEGNVVPRSGNIFTVAVLPLRHEMEDAPNREAAEEVYRALLTSLASIPNLVLVDPTTSADYTLTVTGKAESAKVAGLPLPTARPFPVPAGADAITARIKSPAGQFRVQVRLDSATQQNRKWDYTTILVIGPLPNLCQATIGRTPWLCVTPTSRVPQAIEDLRLQVFPPDLSMQREFRARLRDSALEPEDRIMSGLLKLSMLSRTPRSGFWEGDWEPADLAAALDLSKPRRPDLPDNWRGRTLVLEAMREVKNPELVPPLIDLMQQDASEEVRMEAARILGQNFAGNTAARSALESAAFTDSSEQLRQLVERTLVGDKASRDHIVATLNDSRLGAVERTKPLVDVEQTTYSRPGTARYPSSSLLDESMVLSVVGILPTLMADPEWPRISGAIMRILESSNHPDVKGAMMQAIQHEGDPSTAHAAAGYLLERYGKESGVRRALEEAASKNYLIRETLDDPLRAPSR